MSIRRTLKNSRLVCKKDDVHVCIMCLRAIMNYQVSSVQSAVTLICPLKHNHLSEGKKKSQKLFTYSFLYFSLCLMLSFPFFQYGFNMVMSHPHAVNEIALSLNNKNPR